MQAAEARLPTRIGNYRILRRLAVGGTSDVLLARWDGPQARDQTVALKLLLPAYRQDPQFEGMFAREAAAYARLTHPSIVRLFDFFATPDRELALVLEYVDGLALNRFRALLASARHTLDDRAVMALCAPVFEALAAAHAARDPETGHVSAVVHRDVNPSNVLISWGGDAKLTDFGIAKISGMPSDTRAGMVKGTFGYMAPEQVRGEAVSPRADVYAASLVLWELLARRRAIQQKDLPEYEILRAMAHPNIPSLDLVRPDLPPRLREVVHEGLEVDPQRRAIPAARIAEVLRAAVPRAEGASKLVEALELARVENAKYDDGVGVPRTVPPPPAAPTPSPPMPRLSPSAGIPRPTVGAPPSAPATSRMGLPPAPAPKHSTLAGLGATMPLAPAFAKTLLASPQGADSPFSPRAPTPFPASAAHAPPPPAPLAFAPPPPPAPTSPEGPFSPRAPTPFPPASASASVQPLPTGQPAYLIQTEAEALAFDPTLARPPIASLASLERLSGAPPAVNGGTASRVGWIVGLVALGVFILGGTFAAVRVALAPRPIANAPPLNGIPSSVPAIASSASASASSVPAIASSGSGIASSVPASASSVPAVASSVPAIASSGAGNAPASVEANDGVLVVPTAGGHRVFVDGKVVAQSPARVKVTCGPHEVKVGSAGRTQTVAVPCGGEATAR